MRLAGVTWGVGGFKFQSTHPVRGATGNADDAVKAFEFQSTHPVRGATEARPHGDGWLLISIHAPREGCDTVSRPAKLMVFLFQSTHPVRGATLPPCPPESHDGFQSTHPVRGATLHGQLEPEGLLISIHAPREGCDRAAPPNTRPWAVFQSTHPVRGATNKDRTNGLTQEFQSTHPVRGATPARSAPDAMLLAFQSTHPVRGATLALVDQQACDVDFNPRTP